MSTAVSRVIERWKLTVQVPADAISMSGANALIESARLGRIAIGNDGVSGNDAL